MRVLVPVLVYFVCRYLLNKLIVLLCAPFLPATLQEWESATQIWILLGIFNGFASFLALIVTLKAFRNADMPVVVGWVLSITVVLHIFLFVTVLPKFSTEYFYVYVGAALSFAAQISGIYLGKYLYRSKLAPKPVDVGRVFD